MIKPWAPSEYEDALHNLPKESLEIWNTRINYAGKSDQDLLPIGPVLQGAYNGINCNVSPSECPFAVLHNGSAAARVAFIDRNRSKPANEPTWYEIVHLGDIKFDNTVDQYVLNLTSQSLGEQQKKDVLAKMKMIRGLAFKITGERFNQPEGNMRKYYTCTSILHNRHVSYFLVKEEDKFNKFIHISNVNERNQINKRKKKIQLLLSFCSEIYRRRLWILRLVRPGDSNALRARYENFASNMETFAADVYHEFYAAYHHNGTAKDWGYALISIAATMVSELTRLMTDSTVPMLGTPFKGGMLKNIDIFLLIY